MIKHSPYFILSIIVIITIGLIACQPQSIAPTPMPLVPSPTIELPTPTPTLPLPTSIPATIVPPSPVATITPQPTVQVSSLQEIVGSWKSKCDIVWCLFTFKADGNFTVTEIYEGVPVMDREWGFITLVDGIFHIESKPGGTCGTDSADYRAFITAKNGTAVSLQFEAVQPDACADRQKSLERVMPFFSQ